MLGTVSREKEALRERVELADELFAAIEAADDTLRYAAPEEAESARFELVMAARHGVQRWAGR